MTVSKQLPVTHLPVVSVGDIPDAERSIVAAGYNVMLARGHQNARNAVGRGLSTPDDHRNDQTGHLDPGPKDDLTL